MFIDIDFSILDKGLWDYQLKRGWANPKNCDNIDDFVDTLVHETVHQILDIEFGTTEIQDHWLIHRLGWINEYID